MNEKEQLIEEIKQAPDVLIKEVLNFLLFTKDRAEAIKHERDTVWEAQLVDMAQDQQIQAEISQIEQEFSITEMDGIESE